jgi:hypothetical protein
MHLDSLRKFCIDHDGTEYNRPVFCSMTCVNRIFHVNGAITDINNIILKPFPTICSS